MLIAGGLTHLRRSKFCLPGWGFHWVNEYPYNKQVGLRSRRLLCREILEVITVQDSYIN
jgi:hypothetical protein